MKCKRCGCTDDDCTWCYDRTGVPCFWLLPRICSACATIAELLAVWEKTKGLLYSHSIKVELHRRIDEWEATK